MFAHVRVPESLILGSLLTHVVSNCCRGIKIYTVLSMTAERHIIRRAA